MLMHWQKGYSGIRLETVNTLIEMLNKGVHPIIPEKGSLETSKAIGTPCKYGPCDAWSRRSHI